MSRKTSGSGHTQREERGSPSSESRPNPPDTVKSEVLESALGELMEMSDTELMDSLASLSGEADVPNLLAGEANGLQSEMESDTNDSTEEVSLGDQLTNGVTDKLESDGQPPAQPVDMAGTETDDRIKEDPITLFLIQNQIVHLDQVSTALQDWNAEDELWRVVASEDGVDSERVFAVVAKKSGFPAYTYLDAAPTRELIDELESYLGAEKLSALLDRGLLPVDLEPLSDDSQYRLMIVTHDPSDASINEYLDTASISGVCLYAPRGQVRERIATVRTWIDAPFGVELSEDSDMEHEATDLDSSVSMLEPDTSSDQEESTFGYSGADNTFSGDGQSSQAPEAIEIADYSEGLPNSSTDVDDDAVITIPTDENEKDLASLMAPAARDRVIKSLLQNSIVSEKDVQQGIAAWQAEGGKEAIWRVVAALPDINREAIYQEAARVYAFKQEDIIPGRPDFDFVIMTMETVAEEKREELLDLLLLPFEHVIDYDTGAGRMVFVTPDPSRPEVNRLLHELDLGRFELRYAPESVIGDLLDELFPRKNEYLERISDETTSFDLGMSFEDTVNNVDEEALDAEINRSKLINLFEATLIEATRMGASDIHILPNPKRQIEIHFRVDGRLKKWHTEDGVPPEAFISVVKDNSVNVDRFERDAAQDGFIQRRIDEALIRFRVSILPIASANQEIRAESIVIRILDDRKVLTELTDLGMLDTALARFDQAIRQPHGMVILTGPTGSGKSTTLVAALHQVVTPEVNVLTVEDPVEYIINGVRQIKLSHKLDLESALRSILRHDPDIVMVGEMRDQHTAELAIKLANTGHLTFSTLHTNDAPAAISRLYKMGVEPFLIAYAINLVVAQRLIRGLCPTCKSEDTQPDEVLMRSLGWKEDEIKDVTVFKAKTGSKCKTCNGIGYKGRRAICETLYFTDDVRHLIAESGTDIDEEAIRDAGKKNGMLTLMDSARKLVEMGATSLDEMLRVTGAE